jgi:hypothetical protein
LSKGNGALKVRCTAAALVGQGALTIAVSKER